MTYNYEIKFRQLPNTSHFQKAEKLLPKLMIGNYLILS